MIPAELSRMEFLCLGLFVGGATSRQVGNWLRISEETVKSYRKRAIAKFRRVGFVGPCDKLSLNTLMSAEPRTWRLAGEGASP